MLQLGKNVADADADLGDAGLGDRPPAYSEAAETKSAMPVPVPVPEYTFKPETLYMVHRFIHRGHTSGQAIYELSHHVDYLTDTDHKVVLEKLDYASSQSGGAQPKKRSMVNLLHPKKWELANFVFLAEAQTRRAPPHMGITMSGSGVTGRKRFHFPRCERSKRDDKLHATEAVLFEAVRPVKTDDHGVIYEWSDGQGRLLAREILRYGVLSMAITADMTSQQRDGLVTAWVLRKWWEMAGTNPPREKFKDKVVKGEEYRTYEEHCRRKRRRAIARSMFQ